MDKEIKKILSNWIKEKCVYDDGDFEWYKIKNVVPTNVIKNILALNFRCFFNNKGEIVISKEKM